LVGDLEDHLKREIHRYAWFMVRGLKKGQTNRESVTAKLLGSQEKVNSVKNS
jgi:hypothetical protein